MERGVSRERPAIRENNAATKTPCAATIKPTTRTLAPEKSAAIKLISRGIAPLTMHMPAMVAVLRDLARRKMGKAMHHVTISVATNVHKRNGHKSSGRNIRASSAPPSLK